MSIDSKIDWTDSSWNPIRGCSRVSEGCRNCYAEATAYRFSGPGMSYDGLAVLKNGHASWTGKVEFVEKNLLQPLKWRPVKETQYAFVEGHPRMTHTRPRRIFVNSMSDLFHEQVEDEWLYKILAVVYNMPQHQFQVLTKRAALMLQRMSSICVKRLALTIHQLWIAQVGEDKNLLGPGDFLRDIQWPLPNLWLGVSCEDQNTADERIPLLLQTPAALRFISAEPLLGPVSLEELPSHSKIGRFLDALSNAGVDKGAEIATKLDWVICGGESGPGARPMEPAWALSLRDQCAAANVPYFFKQWGAWLPPMTDGGLDHTGALVLNCSDQPKLVGKKAAGHLLDGCEYRQFPEAL